MPKNYSNFNILYPIFYILFSVFCFLFCFNVLAAEEYFIDGTLLKGAGPEVFVLENGMRRHILNPEVFNGLYYDWQKIILVDDEVLKNYPIGEKVVSPSRFLNGTLIKGSGPRVYLTKSSQRCWIPDPETFNNLGLKWRNIITVPDERLEKIWEGKKIEPRKTLIKYPETFILEKPLDILEGNKVTFKFSGKTWVGEQSDLTFETFLEGYDTEWESAWGDKRSLTLPSKSAPYIFFVRAKDKEGNYDPTPAKHSFEVKISPYFGDIEIKSKNIKEFDVDREYLSLYNGSDKTIEITGWQLESREGGTKYYLPDAYEIPRHRYFEYKKNIELLPQGEVKIFSGRSPIEQNFRVNKCTGFLNQDYQFYLPLPEECPKPEGTELNNFSQSCKKFIENLAECKIPETLKLNQLENECRSYILENINYSSCLSKHKQDLNFFEKTWYVYLGKTSEIWDNTGDTIILRDKDGLFVTDYSY